MVNGGISTSIPRLGAVLAILILATAGITALGRLGVTRQSVVASLRAVVQLGAVSLIIVFVLRSGWLTAGFVSVMFAVAAITAGGRMGAGLGHVLSGHIRRGLILRGLILRGLKAGLPIAAGVAPVGALLLATGLIPTQPIAIVPIAGILIGGAMTATGLAGRRALDELHNRHGEFEAYLAVGFTERWARREICRPATAQALFPALDQTRSVGLVTLPGAFVGVLLGGASPVQAGATQLLVLIGLLAVEAVAVLAVVELISAGTIAGGNRTR